MIPIRSVNITTNGIVVIFPNIDNSANALIQLDIFYTENNPLLNWVNCSNNIVTLWSKTSTVSPNGTIFIYQTNDNLSIGFYIIKATYFSSSQNRTGEITIGVYEQIPSLVIGAPYSMYPPISLF